MIEATDHQHVSSSDMKTVALIGNPNVGKTALFNALTGQSQAVGNWPGVTVEKALGYRKVPRQGGMHTIVEVIDLPGIYTVTSSCEGASADESITQHYVLTQTPSWVVNVVDASQLERGLYVTTQLLEMGYPMLIVCTKADRCPLIGLDIDYKALALHVGCPVVAVDLRRGVGLEQLDVLMDRFLHDMKGMDGSVERQSDSVYALEVHHLIQEHKTRWVDRWAREDKVPLGPQQRQEYSRAVLHCLSDDRYAQQHLCTHLYPVWREEIEALERATGQSVDTLIAQARYQYIHQLLDKVVHKRAVASSWTQKIDAIVLHRWLGIPVFLSVMYMMFFLAVHVAGSLQSVVERLGYFIGVDGLSELLHRLKASEWLISLLTGGVGQGVVTVLTFVPVVGGMFLVLAVLEECGYMSRIAVIMDRFMRWFGLPGKSLIPMVIGLGCNVPAVMSTRTLDHQQDRVLAALMVPFMSCSARLAIYTVFGAAFFPETAHRVIFALYLIGLVMAVLSGLLWRQTCLQGKPSWLSIELPSYQKPQLRKVGRHAIRRLSGFVIRSGKWIVTVSVVVTLLQAIPASSIGYLGHGSEGLLSVLSQKVTPLLAPMGIDSHNWPATVGLITGLLAKEIVIGTLNTLYAQHAVQSFYASAALIRQHFGGPEAAFSYLLFILLYAPCISTLMALWREIGLRWMVFSLAWSTGLAYCSATLFYQWATWREHPMGSCVWTTISITLAVGVYVGLRRYGKKIFGDQGHQRFSPPNPVLKQPCQMMCSRQCRSLCHKI